MEQQCLIHECQKQLSDYLGTVLLDVHVELSLYT